MKWKWIDADCTSVTTAEGTLTLKGLFIPLFIEQLLMNMTGTKPLSRCLREQTAWLLEIPIQG